MLRESNQIPGLGGTWVFLEFPTFFRTIYDDPDKPVNCTQTSARALLVWYKNTVKFNPT